MYTVLNAPYQYDSTMPGFKMIRTAFTGIDNSAQAVLRILLNGRNCFNEFRAVSIFNCRSRKKDYVTSVFENLYGDMHENEILVVTELANANLDAESLFIFSPGLRLDAILTTFYRQNKVGAKVYRDGIKVVIVFEKKMTARMWHTLISTYPVLVPAFFTDKPLSEQEKHLLKIVADENASAFYDYTKDYLENANFKKNYIEHYLRNYTDNYIEKKTQQIKDRCKQLESQILDLELAIQELYNQRQEQYLDLYGIKYGVESGGVEEKNQELIDFLTSSKAVGLITVNGTEMILGITTTLCNYDLDMLEKFLSRESNEFSRIAKCLANDYDISAFDVLDLVNRIFITQEAQVRMFYKIAVDFVEKRYHLVGYDTSEGIANPHLRHYSCFGGNGPLLMRAINDSDYITAFGILVSTVGNLNIAESINCANFMRELFQCKTPHILLPNGEYATAITAIEWFKNREEKYGT